MTFLSLFESFMDNQKKLDKTSSLSKSMVAYKLTVKFLASLKLKDIALEDLNEGFIESLYYFAQKAPFKYSEATARNACYALKSVIKFGIMEKQIVMRNPFDGFKFHPSTNDTNQLTIVDLIDLENAILPTRDLEEVRDMYLFCCLTGLTYSGLKTFHNNCSVETDDEGNQYLMIKATSGRANGRQPVMVPLVNQALDILQRYDFRLPIRCYERDKEALKKIARIIHLDGELTVSLARTTFTAYMLNFGLMDIKNIVELVGQRSGISKLTLSTIATQRIVKQAFLNMEERFGLKAGAEQLKATDF